MLGSSRNRLRYKDWLSQPFNRDPNSYVFDCDNPRVNNFYLGEFLHYERLLLCKTYELTTHEIAAENLPPLAFISYCNDSVKITKMVKELVKLPEAKPLKYYPAVKIVWLGVNKIYQEDGIGTHLLNITKLLFISEGNRTGCRVITVDAMNDPEKAQRPVRFYGKNGFVFVNENNTPEKNAGQSIYPMFFDLGGPWEYDTEALQLLQP
jgi:ribosomal protein S18 acetylase RimI-like enzyme